MASKRTVYFVRGGTHQGAYLKLRTRGGNGRKYAWPNHKENLVEMSYETARNAIRNTYGGTLVKRVYAGSNLIAESVIN